MENRLLSIQRHCAPAHGTALAQYCDDISGATTLDDHWDSVAQRGGLHARDRTREDGTMTGKRYGAAAIGALCALLAAGVTAQAQGRFDPMAREAVAAVPGLEVVSVRDRALGTCYTLFLLQPQSVAPVTPPIDARTVVAAAAERDRRLDAVSAELHRLETTQKMVTVQNPLQHQLDGEKALADFEQVAREAILAKVDARLAEIAAAPRLAVAGPSRCPSVPPVAETFTSAGQP
jgi:hypothetical protein